MLAFPWDMPEHLTFPAGGVQQTGEHLEGGGLAGAIRTQETHHLARYQVESQPVHCHDFLHAPVEQGAHGRAHAGLAFRDPIGFT